MRRWPQRVPMPTGDSNRSPEALPEAQVSSDIEG
jgi:hypothetical protein